jgi:hypothetical protein
MKTDLTWDELKDVVDKRLDHAVDALVNAKDKAVADGSGPLPGSISRQIGNLTTAVKANDPDGLIKAVHNQTAILGNIHSVIPKSARTIADGQRDAADRIASAIEGHTDVIAQTAAGRSASPAPVGTSDGYTRNAALFAAFAIDPSGVVQTKDVRGAWLVERGFNHVEDIAQMKPSDFIRKMRKPDPAPPEIEPVTEVDLKSFHELARSAVDAQMKK